MFIKEQAIGLIYSIALHVGLVALVFISVNPDPIKPPQGISIQAEIIDLSQLKNPPKKKPSSQQKKTPPKPKPKPEEKKPEPKPKPKPKPIEKKPEPKKAVQKPKIDPKKRQEKTERQKKLEELRKKRLAAEQKKPEPVQTTEPVEEPTKEPAEDQPVVGTQKGKPNEQDNLKGRYVGSLEAAIQRQWARPISTPKGLSCVIKVKQIPGGGVIDVSIGSPCLASNVVKNSIINAVKKADPLPYTGFEKVFDRSINITFTYQGD